MGWTPWCHSNLAVWNLIYRARGAGEVLPIPELANPLWDFSLAFYGRDEIEQRAIELQDNYGIDVNLLLLCCWCGTQGLELSREWFSSLLARDELLAWRRQCIEPLRQTRRQMKTIRLPGVDAEGHGRLGLEIQRLELQAERLEQDYLLVVLPESEPLPTHLRPALLCRNMRAYWACMGLQPQPEAIFIPFLRAAFPAISPEELSTASGV